MSNLQEVQNVRQIPGEPHRRWFASSAMDLVVWSEPDGHVSSFQLCYDKNHAERAITWNESKNSVSHRAVDDGEGVVGMRHKATPILVPDGQLNVEKVLEDFLRQAGSLPQEIVSVVSEKLGSLTLSGGGPNNSLKVDVPVGPPP